MSRNEMREEYFKWLCDFVYDKKRMSRGLSYNKMFSYLFDTPFSYILPMDGNRAEDGIDLRYRYGRENGITDAAVATRLDNRDCSVLEMMVALALRVEDQIMTNPDIGNRVGQWFWDMIVSMGINMTDNQFDYDRAKKIMWRFLHRTYKRNGEGGLFTIHDPSKDMRVTDIWYQMNFYLNENFGGLDG